jgi:type III pantothenate kinase
MALVLAIDAGNTTVKFGLFAGRELQESWVAPTAQIAHEAQGLLERAPRDVKAVAAASVVRPATTALRGAVWSVLGHELLLLGESLTPPIQIACDQPRRVGSDRLANAIAAREALGAPAVAVDFGTAITIDVVGGGGWFLGGAIAPGLDIGLEGLIRAADLLEPQELRPPDRAIGRNTREAVQAGVVMGAAAAVDGLVRRVWQELGGRCPTIATGGAAGRVIAFCETVREVDEHLTLRGVAIAVEMASP